MKGALHTCAQAVAEVYQLHKCMRVVVILVRLTPISPILTHGSASARGHYVMYTVESSCNPYFTILTHVPALDMLPPHCASIALIAPWLPMLKLD
jgi:hypothetical protein